MSIESRRAREKQARIDSIKESAWKIFLRDGFQNAKIAEIAKECSLGLATLYYYFKDKRQIVYSLMLEYKRENHAEHVALIDKGVTVREFIRGYIDSYLNHLDHFRFFVLADSFYNYHHQYDLTDPVIREYDSETRENGDYILKVLSAGLEADEVDRVRVIVAMILGFLRRYVLLPAKSWPKNDAQRDKMTVDFLELVYGMFEAAGVSLELPLKRP